MSKVLFVICVPVEENGNLAKKDGNGGKEQESEDKEQNNMELVEPGDKVETKDKNNDDEKSLVTITSNANISEINLQNQGQEENVSEESLKIDAGVKKKDNPNSDHVLLRVKSGNSIKLPKLKINGDEIKKGASNEKKNEHSNENKMKGETNKDKFDKNSSKTEVDEKTGNKKSDSSPQNKKEVNYPDDEHKTEYISFVSDGLTPVALLQRVKASLESLDIFTVNWSLTQDNIWVGMFIAGDGEHCEEILNRLMYLDIGHIPGSSISVFPASISVAKDDPNEELKLELDNEKLAEKVSEFKKSIKSRLVVAQVVDSVKSDAVFTFDYLMLLILASLVAIMGLLEASSVTLVASMLISPLMGPIIAFVFGEVIRNWELMKVGVTSELKGLALCIVVGFVSGLIPAGLESAGSQWRSSDSWPTSEMSSRGALRSLPVGVLIALPSGAGVALSILGGKVGSLVGVAISASLLPPAVNAGLLWANAIIVGIAPPPTMRGSLDSTENSSVLQPTSSSYMSGVDCPAFINNEYIPRYSCNMAAESVVLGVVSLLLTIVNIICIIIMGIVVLKIKEVAPIRSVPEAEKDFFAKDLKVARESYETTKGPNSAILGQRFLQEYQKFKQEFGVEDNNTDTELNEILEDVEEGEDVKEILDKLPHKPKRWNPVSFESSYVDNKEANQANQYHTFHGATHRPSSSEVGFAVKKRSVVTPFSPTRISEDDRHNSVYLTTHHFHHATDSHYSPRISLRSPRYFNKKSKSRFHVAKVEEDGHKAENPPMSLSSHQVEKLPVIREQESVPLLKMTSKEV